MSRRFENFSGLTDKEAIERAREAFAEETHFDGFEVWDRARFLYRSQLAD